MDEDTASKFVSSLVKSIQSLCNGYIEFASSIEVIGHIHVNIDRNLKFNYVLSEEVNKSRSEAATVFSSHSYHSKPPPSAAPSKPASAQSDTDRSHQKSHGSRPDDVDPRVPSQLNFSPASRDSFTSGRSDEDGVQTTSSRSRESESSRSPATHTQDSLDRRRKMRSETRTSGNSEPVLKRSRPSGPSSVTFPKEEYEVIEVKEEPDDDDSACLYGNNKSGQSGRGMQDISQPDFSNLVAESLDRVGQHEGAPLMGGNMQHLGEEPFPVTLLHNQAAGQAAPVGLSPGDPQASTSGGPVSFQPVIAPLTSADMTLHVPERGEGHSHRCVVCERKHNQYAKLHPGTHRNSLNPFGRRKSSFRCASCRVYLCVKDSNNCWAEWHGHSQHPSIVVRPSEQQDDTDFMYIEAV